VETLDGSADDLPGPELPPPSATPDTPDSPDGNPVLGGVALDLARRFGVDPLWPRLTFVVLALLQGFGVLVYAGLWLVLIVGRRPGWGAARVAGAGLLVASVFVLQDVNDPWIGSPWTWALLLAGAAAALWAPRGIPASVGPVIDHAQPDDRAGAARATPARRDREPSVLGRAALGVALLVAATGALIDQLNGGRLHPEQWLGAAAIVCGLGMIVGGWRGRGLWLIVPGLLFAGGGFVAGHAARAGVDSPSLGDEDVWIDGGTEGPANSTRTAGIARLTVIDAPPTTPMTSDLRVGIGRIEIDVDDDVTVEVRPLAHDGDVKVDGRVTHDDVISVGPEGDPDVIVTAEISLGDIQIERFSFDEPRVPLVPDALDGRVLELGEGLSMARDGTVILPDGLGAITPDGDVVRAGGRLPSRSDGVTVINTPYGRYLLLPNQMIITPSGALIDVPARRAEVLETPTTQPVTVPTTVPTVAPTTVPTITPTTVPMIAPTAVPGTRAGG
jgi:phage shock protein PspC (stress-responsive transcriptional regulator)